VLHAGVVHQYVDGSDIRLKSVNGRPHRCMIRGIKGKHPRARHRVCRCRKSARITPVQDKLRPCTGQPFGQRQPESL
jgi:hypothetical protein